jgi:hypothetical protein
LQPLAQYVGLCSNQIMRTLGNVMAMVALSVSWAVAQPVVAPGNHPLVVVGQQVGNDAYTGPITIRKVLLTGNKRTKDYIVLREVALKAGITYSAEDFKKKWRLTHEQLMNTTLFIAVAVDSLDLGGGEVDLKIEVKERWYVFPVPYFKVVDRNWNVWINEHKASLDRTNLGLKLIHGNTTGRNDKFNLLIIGGYTQALAINYSQPYVDKKLSKGFTSGFSYSRNREVNTLTLGDKQVFSTLSEFARQSIRADIGFTYRRGSDLRMGLRLNYNYEAFDSALVQPMVPFPPGDLPPVVPNPNLLRNGRRKASFVELAYTAQLLRADYNPYPLRGYKLDSYATLRLGGGLDMFQIGGNATASWEVMKKTYLQFQHALAYTPNQTQPYYNLKMMGYGALTMQGLENYVVDGTFGAMFRMTPKYRLLNFHLRNLVRNKDYNDIPVRVFLKAYGNLGYVFNNNDVPAFNNIMPNRLLRSAGLGVDFVTIYDVVLKLEYSFNQFGERGFFIRTASDF